MPDQVEALRDEPRGSRRCVIAEDETLLREGLALVLQQAGFDIVGSAVDAPGLLALTLEHVPDLVVTDIRMPPHRTDDGLRVAVRIRTMMPRVGVVVVSQHLQRSYAMDLIGDNPAGVGYLLKQRIGDIPTFCADLERVCAGGTALDPEVAALMLSRARTDKEAVGRLTARQQEVLAAMAEGRSNAAIARALFISDKAVVGHVSHIYDQLGLPDCADDHRRVLAVVRYLNG
ncbi:MAG TPA: response regulator transcription factor [Flexivirga sp.]|uniref:response regulator transcription factor n=1 Tax=Flexivirga sp. TaxID=1962927 RepID=UPI002C435875|nr:response regulator transcription factor [Flexivirga sp.]HWC21129.1 response regulator transcription factor [Flexivirga sp.]